MEKNPTILIVDDETDVGSVMEDFLSDYDYKVITAGSGHEALSIMEKSKVDVVISDLVMPRMDGIALTRSIKELGLDIPVIIMTGYASIDSAVESMKAGAADFITKPFKFNHTLFVLEKVLETKRLQALAQESEYYKKLSNLDELTGIPNYRSFKQMLLNEIQRHHRYEHPLSLIMADIDNFKQINDSHGHLIGDRMLERVAKLIKKSIRGCDFLARYGGEEFCVILPETPNEEAFVVGNRIVKNVNDFTHRIDNGHMIKLSITAGLATFPFDADSPTGLINAADQALYNGKQIGKNCIRKFNEI